jgi:hypothetical protein
VGSLHATRPYRLRLHGFPIRWQTRIETWEPPLRFSDTQVRGPFSLWEHTHVFEPNGEHACTIHDRVRYATPYGPLGELATFAVLVLAFVVFRVGGGVAGMIVIVAAWIPMVLFAIQGRGKPPVRLGMAARGEGPRHRVLVIANQGLEDPALCAEVCRRSDRTATEAMILAPVVASSPLRELADDVDRELDLARRRLDAAVQSLHREGVTASGRESRSACP